MKKQGFSLLELLVVIGIISLLLSVAISSYSTAQKKTRDAKRQADLKTIQQSAEQYYSICGFSYPNFAGGALQPIICTTSSPTQVILPTEKLPKDPKTNNVYTCYGSCTTSSFTLCATPELANSICVSSQQ